MEDKTGVGRCLCLRGKFLFGRDRHRKEDA
jgi:hypothetical protein